MKTAHAKPFTNRMGKRLSALLPGGVPRYVRTYDNGGETIDRFTVCFTGRAATTNGGGAGWPNGYPYVAMNAAPFHPQGFGQHGESKGKPCDVNKHGFAPAIGRRNHLGTRIRFEDLPEDCRKLVLQDYKEIWGLP